MAKKKKAVKKSTKKSTVSKSTKSVKRKRRTKQQICDDLRRERAALYTKRNRLVKKSKSGKLNDDEQKQNDREWKKVQNRLENIKGKLFKCSKKYDKFKEQRAKLRRHQYYLAKKIKKGREEGMSNTEINRIGVEERKTIEAIHALEKAMKLPVGTLRSGKTGFQALRSGKFVEQELIYFLPEHFQMWLNSGYFHTLVLDNKLYDMADEPMVALAAVYEAVDWAMAWQHVYGSPFYFAFGDAENGYLEIKVAEYTTDMYSKEIGRQGRDV